MTLSAQQEELERGRQMLPQRSDMRGHAFRKQGNMLSGGTISESWYSCACGATLDCRVDLSGPAETHVPLWSEVLFDCPLAPEGQP